MKYGKLHRIAKHKIVYCSSKTWGGYLTQMEVKYLLNIGCKLVDSHWDNTEEIIDNSIKKGISYPTWYYFKHISFDREVDPNRDTTE